MTRMRLGCTLMIVIAAYAPAEAGPAALRRLLEAASVSGYPGGSARPPEFHGTTPDGRSISLAALRGRVVLLTFWTTWCAPCREEMPGLERLHRELAPKGLAILAVNVREDATSVQEYARELGLSLVLVLDPSAEMQLAYGVIGLPTTFLIGRDGRAVGRVIGPLDWTTAEARALIAALLTERNGLPAVR